METKAEKIGSILYEIIATHPDRSVVVNALKCIKVLELGEKKHGTAHHRGAMVDISHARNHILAARLSGELTREDPESGQPHLINAAVDCLLAFGALIGMVKPTEGETLG